MTTGSTTRRIEPKFYSRVWGSPRLEPWFEPRGAETTGEVWFPAGELLIKFIFTSENLSVQVHPDEDYARKHENSHGKTEMWHILRADPGARIALGFKEDATPDQVISAAETGEIMNLLDWMDVHPGETYFVPAGTVHAIGAGLALCEIQQNSDVTYRLFDYGRNRELHLSSAREVMIPGKHSGMSAPRELGNGIRLLAECPWFRTYHVVVDRPKRIGTIAPEPETRFLVVLEGTGRVNNLAAAAGQVFDAGNSEAWCVEPDLAGGSGSMKLLLVG